MNRAILWFKWHKARQKSLRWFIVKALIGLTYRELEDAIYALKMFQGQNVCNAGFTDSLNNVADALIEVSK